MSLLQCLNSSCYHSSHDPNLEEFLNNLYTKSGSAPSGPNTKQPAGEPADAKKRRTKKTKP